MSSSRRSRASGLGAVCRESQRDTIVARLLADGFVVYLGARDVERGRAAAEDLAVAVRLATLDANGPTGEVFEDDHQLAW